jgi:hypothetical protein
VQLDDYNYLLCNNPEIHIKDYQVLKKNRNRAELARFIKRRFTERYLQDFDEEDEEQNMPKVPKRGGSGFASAASAVLTIEALESFREGWIPNNTSGALAFQQFFERNWKVGMPAERVYCSKPRRRVNCSCFYHGIRCAIPHNGETTGGWRLHSHASQIFQPASLILNPRKLRQLVRVDLKKYANDLAAAAWSPEFTSPLWTNFLRRMDWTVRHCKRTRLGGEGEMVNGKVVLDPSS